MIWEELVHRLLSHVDSISDVPRCDGNRLFATAGCATHTTAAHHRLTYRQAC